MPMIRRRRRRHGRLATGVLAGLAVGGMIADLHHDA